MSSHCLEPNNHHPASTLIFCDPFLLAIYLPFWRQELLSKYCRSGCNRISRRWRSSDSLLARMSASAWEILDTAEPRTISPRMLARVSLVDFSGCMAIGYPRLSSVDLHTLLSSHSIHHWLVPFNFVWGKHCMDSYRQIQDHHSSNQIKSCLEITAFHP